MALPFPERTTSNKTPFAAGQGSRRGDVKTPALRTTKCQPQQEADWFLRFLRSSLPIRQGWDLWPGCSHRTPGPCSPVPTLAKGSHRALFKRCWRNFFMSFVHETVPPLLLLGKVVNSPPWMCGILRELRFSPLSCSSSYSPPGF